MVRARAASRRLGRAMVVSITPGWRAIRHTASASSGPIGRISSSGIAPAYVSPSPHAPPTPPPVRVIAGRYGGRRLHAPPGRATRPTSDRVREALFSILGARVDGARVLDLFAGSGALG